MFNQRQEWNRGKRVRLGTRSTWQLSGTYLEQGIHPLVHVAFWSYTLPVSLFLELCTDQGQSPQVTQWDLLKILPGIVLLAELCPGSLAVSQQTQTQQGRLTKYWENRQKGRVGCTRTPMVPSSPAGTTAPCSSTICTKDRHSRAWISSQQHLLQLRAGHRRDTGSTASVLYPQLPHLHVPAHHKGEQLFPKSQV